MLSLALFLSPSAPLTNTANFRGLRLAVRCSSEISTFREVSSGGANRVSVIRTTPPWVVPADGEEAKPIPATRTVRIRRKGGKFTRKLDRSLTDKVGGVRAKKVVDRIAEKINRLRETVGQATGVEDGEVGFDLRLGENEGEVVELGRKGMMPWVKDDGKEGSLKENDPEGRSSRRRRKRMASGEELGIEEGLLRRLRSEAERMRKWVKVMKIGVSEEVVGEIRRTWRTNELVMVKFHMPLCRNMDRAQEILEMKTGGLVVWRKKDVLVVYRGSDYSSQKLSGKPYNILQVCPKLNTDPGPLRDHAVRMEDNVVASKGEDGMGFFGETGNFEPINGSLCERETDRLLDGLGPRFIDWWKRKPLPIDADLLPETVPGFLPPLRLTLAKERSQLTDSELTFLRKLAHTLPVHFALGKNRNLQGLAAAILKLWEKSIIVKIAVKWGVQNAKNGQMAYELKRLTGGVLILRNKFFIILFRGKDFIPPGLATSVIKRERELRNCQLSEEYARVAAFERLPIANELFEENSTSGTLSEFQEICSHFVGQGLESVEVESEMEKLRKELAKQGRRLYIMKSKLKKSTKQLRKLNDGCTSAEPDYDKEIITEEERVCLRNIGLKMDGTLVLGKRGVFDGVIEALHQHWKHREVVKVITKQRTYREVLLTAQLLELESRGIMVSIDKQKEGHAIILYRGKNYRRPRKMETEHLLTKRKALLRSLEIQRSGSLKFFSRQKEKTVSDLRQKLEELKMKLP
ncbi:hypothetical protein MLD38_001234 [Melastoma candidum]|uniref:Uncharacterized protein n=1 Tax=Melastoma candidum TaxID=119954 RepID=A0ACB9SC26_9MYRT|nr:hypothetical protein MLD38_001234 [Melastoma candidum]